MILTVPHRGHDRDGSGSSPPRKRSRLTSITTYSLRPPRSTNLNRSSSVRRSLRYRADHPGALNLPTYLTWVDAVSLAMASWAGLRRKGDTLELFQKRHGRVGVARLGLWRGGA